MPHDLALSHLLTIVIVFSLRSSIIFLIIGSRRLVDPDSDSSTGGPLGEVANIRYSRCDDFTKRIQSLAGCDLNVPRSYTDWQNVDEHFPHTQIRYIAAVIICRESNVAKIFRLRHTQSRMVTSALEIDSSDCRYSVGRKPAIGNESEETLSVEKILCFVRTNDGNLVCTICPCLVVPEDYFHDQIDMGNVQSRICCFIDLTIRMPGLITR